METNSRYVLNLNIITFNLGRAKMITFVIFYGLIEAANAIYVYGKNKSDRQKLIIIFFWGLMFVLIGLAENFGITGLWRKLTYLSFGISWIPMMFMPCTVKIFRVNKTTLLIRNIIFAIIGASQLFIAFG